MFLGGATVIRLYVFEPVKIMDASMAPKFKEQSIVWMCKLPYCFSGLTDQDIVWAKLKSDETQVRSILAMPGDTIEISDKGRVVSAHRNFKWKNEDAFIQSRAMYVPKAGDTLVFSELNDVEQDYVIAYLRDKGENVLVKTTLWQGGREISLDRVGSTKIANRQVSLNEIDFLPWQDRYLIEEQIRQSEPGNAPIKLKRQLFYGEIKKVAATDKKDSTTSQDSTATQDSSVVKDSSAVAIKQDSVSVDTAQISQAHNSQSVKVYGAQINEIVIEDDCYYLICKKGSNCPDSRELGYFRKDQLIGTHVAWPDKIKENFIEPVMKRVRIVTTLVSDTWTHATKWAGDKIDQVKEWFQKKEEPNESAPEANIDAIEKSYKQMQKKSNKKPKN